MKRTYARDVLIRTALASGKYKVDQDGVIWNLDYRGRGERRQVGLYSNRAGYLQFQVTLYAARDYVMAHRFVAFALLGEPPAADWEVNHRDGDKANNSPENLEWVSRCSNMQHAWDMGLKTLSGPVGGAKAVHPGAKLSAEDVHQIRGLLSAGALQREVAEQFGITQSNVSNIKRGKSWLSQEIKNEPQSA